MKLISRSRLDQLSALRSTPHQTTVRFVFYARRLVPTKGGEGITAKTIPSEKTSSTRWKQIARYVKIVRIPFLIGAVYSLGYQQGIVDTIRNPLKIQQGMFENICLQMGVSSGEDIDILSERGPAPRLTRKGLFTNQIYEEENKHRHHTKEVSRIGRVIIRAGQRHVKEELQKAVATAKEKLTDKGLSEIEFNKALNEDEQVVFWVAALQRMEGESFDGIHNWQYVVMGTAVPNGEI
jgi:hypothetical protein